MGNNTANLTNVKCSTAIMHRSTGNELQKRSKGCVKGNEGVNKSFRRSIKEKWSA